MTTKELEVSRAVARELTAEDIKAAVEAKVQALVDKALATPQEEVAELQNWWDLYAIGPIQAIANPAFTPHQVVKIGERVYAITVIWLNPFQSLPPTNAADLLSSFSLPFEIEYQTSNLTTMTPAGSTVHTGNLIPGVYFYVDVAELPSGSAGMYETYILARFLGAVPALATAPHFAGFANAVIDIDAPLFGPTPGVRYEQPVRYMVYP